jgi:hypothetical protein
MNKSLRDRRPESSLPKLKKILWFINAMDTVPKKEPPFPAALKLITGRRQTEWTGATRYPNKDNLIHMRESLIARKLRGIEQVHVCECRTKCTKAGQAKLDRCAESVSGRDAAF